MLKKLILLITVLFLVACSNVVTEKEMIEKKELIKQVIGTPKKEIILLGDNYDYLFAGEEARKVLTLIDFLKVKGLTKENMGRIRKKIIVNEDGNAKLWISTEFIFSKTNNTNDRNFEKEQENFINDFKSKLEDKNIEYEIKEDNTNWRFNLPNAINVNGKVIKLENHDKILQETSYQLINLKIDLFVSNIKVVRKKSFGESVGDFGESVKDGARELWETTAIILTAPIWGPFVVIYTILAIPALLIYER